MLGVAISRQGVTKVTEFIIMKLEMKCEMNFEIKLEMKREMRDF